MSYILKVTLSLSLICNIFESRSFHYSFPHFFVDMWFIISSMDCSLNRSIFCQGACLTTSSNSSYVPGFVTARAVYTSPRTTGSKKFL